MNTELEPVTDRCQVRLVALARLVSVVGSQAAQTALLVDLFIKTHSTAWVSIAAFATVGVLGLLSPLAGAIADSCDRRLVMVVAEICGAAAYLALLVPTGPGATVALVLAGAALNAPVRAASVAIIPTLVTATDMTWANGLLGGSFSTGMLAGPVIGGALTAAGGPQVVYAVNGVTFLLSAAILATVLPRAQVTRRNYGEAGRGAAFAGIAHLAGQRKLRLLSLGSVFLFLAFGLTAVTDLPLSSSFDAGALGFGLLVSCWGGGAIVGSLTCSRLAGPGRERAVSTTGCLAMAAGLGVVAVLPWFPAILVASAIGGLGSGMVFPPWTTLLQTLTPAHLRGRVFAATDALEQTVNAVGILAAPSLLAVIGVRPSYALIGALGALGAVCVFRAATHRGETVPAPVHA